MSKSRLEAFSDGVIAILLAFIHQWISDSIYVFIALMWLVPDCRIESKLKE